MPTDAKSPSPPSPSAAVTAVASSSSSTSTDTAKPSSASNDDVVVLGPPTADGAGVHVLRAHKQRLEAGELRNLEEGKPITGEIVTLAPRKDNPRVCDVKDSYRPPQALSAAGSSSAKKKGPAQVATQEYRDNWDEVFARRPPGSDVLN